MTERWAPIPGWEMAYEASDQGRVRSIDRVVRGRRYESRIVTQTLTRRGRPSVCLSYKGQARRYSVHRLVLEAFVGPRPDGMECCHANDDPLDNRLANLRWDTPANNKIDMLNNGRHYWANQTRCKHGHEYTDENTYYRANGRQRHCRECSRARNRKYEARLRAAMQRHPAGKGRGDVPPDDFPMAW
jgi:hypothetical protein